MTYGNSGSIDATGVVITDHIPYNTKLLNTVTAPNGEIVEYNVGGNWQSTYDVSAYEVRWTTNTCKAGTEKSVTFQVEVK